MRTMKASEARRRWFQLLDEVAAGDEVAIERKGHRIVMRSEPIPTATRTVPDYSKLIRGNVDDADTWGWEWTPEKGLEPRTVASLERPLKPKTK